MLIAIPGTYVDDTVTIDKANGTVRGQGLVRLVRSFLFPADRNIGVTADGAVVTRNQLQHFGPEDGSARRLRLIRESPREGPRVDTLARARVTCWV